MATSDAQSFDQAKSEKRPTTPKVSWDDSQMASSYANVVNAVSSREEFTLFFGTNQTWNASDKELVVHLTNRIMLNPHAAKRLLTLLAAVMKEHERRYGEINIEPTAAKPAATAMNG
ncbi:DUF3467 domain-containing protein [Marinobacterium stanieri]|uniref:DUF3467 domain-containing protein n=1 Tax=Marinobacterium stanieri TaxID=49186 RepID=A0A1N6S7D3_9GAMM|nr:DUF3467 domain-containing protein [Marinobacterium stanieri]SIQ37001.1 Protein of unknown function [Marinobacterium stanieri]